MPQHTPPEQSLGLVHESATPPSAHVFAQVYVMLVPEPVARLAASQWNDYPTPFSDQHFAELRRILDQQEPDYRT